jgi:glycosyltransferase involved in cell wall biosynthesis
VNLHEVTIVVPTKNEEANIGRFLRSVPAAISMVVVDSSDDTTPAMIERLRPGTVVLRARANIPVARQLGADTASTEWLLFTDADVVFAPGYFERLARIRDQPGDGGIVGTKGSINGFDTYHRWFRAGQRLLSIAGVPAATGSNMLLRSSTLRAIGGFDPDLSVNEDTEVMFRVKRSGHAVRFDPDLAVLSFDHRRLEKGLARKVAHGAVRNTALYLGLFDRRVRASDWGYWGEAAGS